MPPPPAFPMHWLACPLDGTELCSTESGLRCAQGHGFDRAREGYYNLLLNQHKSSSDPGDSREMVRARTASLESGLFKPLVDRIHHHVGDLAKGLPRHILDAGCGEGYYLDALQRRMPDMVCAGLDISKAAVQPAARRNPDCLWLVGNNRHLPFAEESTDLILCLFGFPVFDVFRHIQPGGGHILIVDPAEDHLLELRRIIYPEVRRSAPPALDASMAAGYDLVLEDRLTYKLPLHTPEQIDHLLKMTPHYFRMPKEGRDSLAAIARLDVTFDLSLRLLAAH